MAEELQRLKGIRTAYKKHCTKNQEAAERIMLSTNPDFEDLENILEVFTLRLEKICAMDQKIEALVTPDSIDEEVGAALDFYDKSVSLKNRITNFLQRRGNRGDIGSHLFPIRTASSESNVNLTKTAQKGHSSDPLEWISFWESFQTAGDGNRLISNVEKTNYLKSVLNVDAERYINGLSLSIDNYTSTVQLLKQRFVQQKQALINVDMEALWKTPNATTYVNELRTFDETMEGYVRALEALQVKSESYCCLLLPALLKKIPEEVRRELLRVAGYVDVNTMRDLVLKEVESREKWMLGSDNRDSTLNHDKSIRKYVGPISSVNAMFRPANSEDQSKTCMFCVKEHVAEGCILVTSSSGKRINTLTKQERCFKCHRPNYTLRNCKTSSRRDKCNGKHRQSICRTKGSNRDQNANKNKDQSKSEGEGRQEIDDHKENNDCKEKADSSVILTSTMHHVHDNTIMLQTASIFVTSSSKRRVQARVLFDTGAQRTFITRKLVSSLACPSSCKENVSVSSFGKDSWSSEQFEVVLVELISTTEEISIEALVTTTISSPIKMNVNRKWLRQPHLDHLTLADNFYEGDVIEVDILIGCDYYGSLMTGNMIQQNGIMAMGSVFGWLLSGPIRPEHPGYY